MRTIFFPFAHPVDLPHCALSIGNFDGVHRGHRALLSHLREAADNRNLKTALLTFEPHSRRPFSQHRSPPRLSKLCDKLILLSETQLLDYVFVYHFTPRFAALTPRDFINNILVNTFRAQYLLVGKDFRFGKARSGDLSHLAHHPSLDVEVMPTLTINNQRVSSSLIRESLSKGDLENVQALLGQPYQITGKVAYGRQMGRTLGFPTANLHLSHCDPPLKGTFIVEVVGSFGRRYGVANLGKNPTINLANRYKLEAHLFDYCGILYGERITVIFLKKLRDEKRFNGLVELTAQIHDDVAQTKAYLANLSPGGPLIIALLSILSTRLFPCEATWLSVSPNGSKIGKHDKFMSACAK